MDYDSNHHKTGPNISQQLAEDVQLGLDQLERGEYYEYDEAGLRNLFEELKDRVNRRIAARGENR